MKILSLSDRDLQEAADALAAGRIVAFPTETVYGLGGDAFNVSSLARIFTIKNRPRFDPLIVHIASLDKLDELVQLELLGGGGKKKFEILAKEFWPGPLTMILPKRPELPDLATSGLPTAAVRFPVFPATQKLIKLSGKFIAAPSANPFGSLSPTKAAHVISQLGDKIDFIIDGEEAGQSQVFGLESTILDLTSDELTLLRPGCISREQLEEKIGPIKIAEPKDFDDEHARLSPGQMKTHYAPRTRLCLHPLGTLAAIADSPDEGKLLFSHLPNDENPAHKTLSPKADLAEAAANFFDMLHDLDKLGLKIIRAEEAPPHGIGTAINDRLRRASATFDE